ncbi:MAG: CocE/NonD family hydrolase [Chloroflexota bacterium]
MQPTYEVEMRLNVKTPMRDGINLSSDVYLPKAAGPFPTVLIRTPYGNNSENLIRRARALANIGYACVVQDTRGRWDSEGEFRPFFNEADDGRDTHEWIGQQPWSNGKIGTSGGSYLGITQWLSAPDSSEYLTCMSPRVICTEFFTGLAPGGAFQLGVMFTWGMSQHGRTVQSIEFHNWTEEFHRLPIAKQPTYAGREIDFWADWVEHPTYDDLWASINVQEHWGDITVPAFNMGGWYDLWASNTFENFVGMREHGGSEAARKSKLIVGPWPHALSASTRVGEIDFGAQSMADLETMELQWLDYWLKGKDNGVLDEAPIKLFIMGINQWRDEYEWPLARTDWQTWYLHSDGHANTLRGDGTLSMDAPNEEPSDSYVYDPRYPVQTKGGNTCCAPHVVPWGPYDQRSVEMRSDVLCYTTPPLTEDTEVTGPITLILYASTDCPDTDWTAKLVDVSPSGYAKNLCDGIIRARFRESYSDPTLLEPNKIYEYEIHVGVTGNVFRKGHSIRLEVSSSNFPRFARNLNTGYEFAGGTEMRTASQTIYHRAEYASRLVLPVISNETN